MPNTTSRLGLTEPVGTDGSAELRESITNNAVILDNAVTFTEGTLVARPTAGTAGRVYYATDTEQWFDDNGTSWQPRPYGFPARGYRTAATTLSGGGWYVILIDTVAFDAGSAISNGAYNCPRGGYYQINSETGVQLGASYGVVATGLYRNGTLYEEGGRITVRNLDVNDIVTTSFSDIVTCNAGDYLEVAVFLNSTASGSLYSNFLSVQPLA